VAPAQPPASIDADELAEVRAALEEVAEASEAPVTAPEPEPPAPPPAATSPAPIQEALVDVPTPPAARVGGALVLTLGTPPATFTVAKTSATLGRGQENTIRLDDLSVSRRHARIAYRQGGYWLSDLGSMGGTWVDGARLNAPRRLASGDVIDIGLCRLTVNVAGDAAKAETKSASKPRSEVAGQVRRRR
jgi:pSer/pThr/pTyr-binding forkhead associated (FHA) protein